jgi:hypothetical protein
MSFYDLSKEEREKLAGEIHKKILSALSSGSVIYIHNVFADADTYIRKTAYLAVGRIYEAEKGLKKNILRLLEDLISSKEFHIRQTAINAAGEIGKSDFEMIESIMEKGMIDKHPSPRNAVIGSLKKMGEINPVPVLKFAAKFIHHPDKEVRREICHGLELRGRTHPEEILPLLRELEYENTARVKHMLIHVIGQISYKEGCLAIVIESLKNWDNKEILQISVKEIINVHKRYKNFAAMSRREAETYIKKNV